MIKTVPLNKKEQRFVSTLRASIKKKGEGIPKIRLMQLTAIAFHNTGTGREDKMVDAMARGLTVRERMATEEGGNMSAEDVARQLGMSKQSVLNLYHAGRVLGWKTPKQGAIRFPVWQFDGRDRLPGLEETLAKLNAAKVLDDWGKIGFFLQTLGILGDRRPLDLLRENKVDVVLQSAEAYVE